MQQRKRYGAKKGIANFFGSLGYLFCTLQWLWAAMLYIGMLQSATWLVPEAPDSKAEELPHFTFTLPSPLEMAIVVAVTVLMIALTAYALMKMPVGIVKTSNKIVHKTAETVAPAVIKAQHRKDTKKLRVYITSRLMLAVKLLLIVLPVASTAASGLLEKQSIDYSIAMVVGCGLAVFTVVFFAIQYALAGLLRVKMAELW